jgi:hypothetical protein
MREKCVLCDEPAQWVRSTQFAGDHPYCEYHAFREPDFDDEPDSYSFWYKIKDENEEKRNN